MNQLIRRPMNSLTYLDNLFGASREREVINEITRQYERALSELSSSRLPEADKAYAAMSLQHWFRNRIDALTQ